jgi:ATP:ADP antiporter, AAA family
MSHHRDPFPMQSAEAKAMEESVLAVGTTGTSAAAGASAATTGGWNSMHTTVSHEQPQAGNTSSSGQDADEESGGAAAGVGLMGDSYNAYEDDETNSKQNPDRDDDFLDRPVWESRTYGLRRIAVRVGRFLEAFLHRLYGDQLSVEEMCRTMCLASTLFFMIGGYWLMRSLKDPVLTALCGVSVIPKAKMLSVFVVLFVVSVYNKLLDSDIPKHKLFYIFGTFYFGLFLLIAILLMHPAIGLANEQPSPSRVLGWISYCSIESFGSVMVSLFWSFTNSNISLETAKASYGVMVAAAQIGSILGPTFVNFAAPRYGPAKCYLVGAFCILLLQVTMYMYISIYGVQENKNAPDAPAAGGKVKEKPGVLEGLHLFWKYNYVKGIFAISCLFMVEVTIVDFTMKVLAQKYFAEEHPCRPGMSCYDAIAPGVHGSSQEETAAFTAFMGFFGQSTNILSFLLSLFGTSAVIRYLGLRLTLLLFPSLCLVVIIIVRLNPTLYTVFGAMMALKACSYALNNPTKEILYQPTSSAVRYKAKSWIDIFGARGSKALGSVVSNAFSDSATNLVANGSLVGMAVASFLIWNARFMGKKFDEYTASGYVVGGEKDEAEVTNIEMAMNQNEGEDTSCAIYEDDDEVGPEEEGQSESGSIDDNQEDEAGDFAKKPEVKRV